MTAHRQKWGRPVLPYWLPFSAQRRRQRDYMARHLGTDRRIGTLTMLAIAIPIGAICDLAIAALVLWLAGVI